MSVGGICLHPASQQSTACGALQANDTQSPVLDPGQDGWGGGAVAMKQKKYLFCLELLLIRQTDAIPTNLPDGN